jgi:hypothetical protein
MQNSDKTPIISQEKSEEDGPTLRVFASLTLDNKSKTTKPRKLSYQEVHHALRPTGVCFLTAKGGPHIERLFGITNWLSRKGIKVIFPEGTLISNADGFYEMVQPVRVEGRFEWLP